MNYFNLVLKNFETDQILTLLLIITLNYLFFNYIKLDESVKHLKIYKKIDLSRFIEFRNIDDLLFTGLFEFIIKNGLSKDSYAHENDAGHKFIAKEILNKIVNKKN